MTKPKDKHTKGLKEILRYHKQALLYRKNSYYDTIQRAKLFGDDDVIRSMRSKIGWITRKLNKL